MSVFPPETAKAEERYLEYLRWVDLTYYIPDIRPPRDVQLQLELLMAEFARLAMKTGGLPPIIPTPVPTTRSVLPR